MSRPRIVVPLARPVVNQVVRPIRTTRTTAVPRAVKPVPIHRPGQPVAHIALQKGNFDPRAQINVVQNRQANHQQQLAVHRARQQASGKKSSNVVSYIRREITDESRRRLRALAGVGKGRILVILGNGPTLLQVPVAELRGMPLVDTMSINKPDLRVWPTTYWLFCDPSQLIRNRDLWDSYHGPVINSTSIKQQRANSMQARNLGGMGFSKDLSDGFYIGRSSVFIAMQAAYWMGYDHIYILGVDMNQVTVNGKSMLHFYGVNPDVDPADRLKRFDNEALNYEHAATILTESERRRYIFCSGVLRYPFASKFGLIHHDQALTQIKTQAASLAS